MWWVVVVDSAGVTGAVVVDCVKVIGNTLAVRGKGVSVVAVAVDNLSSIAVDAAFIYKCKRVVFMI